MKALPLLSLPLLAQPTAATPTADPFLPQGYQSGHFTSATDSSPLDSEHINDDSYAGAMVYDAQHNLVYFTGSTYGAYFDGDLMSGDGNDGGGHVNGDTSGVVGGAVG
mmetsp:Transcript_10543/g.23197  ORF Transcript_10543/g.23197 Transcript_10543/m.23197 type:complete len:108 (-) Transcript_10543:8-331(-)